MLLSEFAANAGVKYELSESMRKRMLPHAILIDGAKGTGKRTLANIIAGYCVCSDSENTPCGKCADCIKAAKGIHPDIFTADGNNSGELNIEAIRSIRSSAYIKPNEARQKVFILLNCERMLAAAQNAFLKVLEEPPENVVFILTAVTSTALLQTVRSRTRIYSLYPPSVEEAEEYLQRRLPDKSPEELRAAAEGCGGNIGMAIELLEGRLEEADSLAREIIKAVPLSTEYRLMQLLSQAVRDRAFAVRVLDAMCVFGMECVRASVGGEGVSDEAAEVARRLTKKRLMKLQEKLQNARGVLNINVNLNFYGTWLCSVLRQQ